MLGPSAGTDSKAASVGGLLHSAGGARRKAPCNVMNFCALGAVALDLQYC
jgi:hypothetical protein